MNRRDFFKTVGIPALALPFVKILPKPESEITYEATGDSCDFPWDTFEATCSHCGNSIHIPYIAGDYPSIYKFDFHCKWCGKISNSLICLKTGEIKAYFNP